MPATWKPIVAKKGAEPKEWEIEIGPVRVHLTSVHPYYPEDWMLTGSPFFKAAVSIGKIDGMSQAFAQAAALAMIASEMAKAHRLAVEACEAVAR